MLGAVAARQFPSVLGAMEAMNAADVTLKPARGRVRSYHERKYKVFHRLHRDFLAYRRTMAG